MCAFLPLPASCRLELSLSRLEVRMSSGLRIESWDLSASSTAKLPSPSAASGRPLPAPPADDVSQYQQEEQPKQEQQQVKERSRIIVIGGRRNRRFDNTTRCCRRWSITWCRKFSTSSGAWPGHVQNKKLENYNWLVHSSLYKCSGLVPNVLNITFGYLW